MRAKCLLGTSFQSTLRHRFACGHGPGQPSIPEPLPGPSTRFRSRQSEADPVTKAAHHPELTAMPFAEESLQGLKGRSSTSFPATALSRGRPAPPLRRPHRCPGGWGWTPGSDTACPEGQWLRAQARAGHPRPRWVGTRRHLTLYMLHSPGWLRA